MLPGSLRSRAELGCPLLVTLTLFCLPGLADNFGEVDTRDLRLFTAPGGSEVSSKVSAAVEGL